jgi:3alpha(or 20beta)-hydroxysteroid dehydrogenase
LNNAGIGYQVPFDEMTEAEYRKFFDINQLGVFLGMKAVAPSMRRAGGGSIINISSTCGFLALPGTQGYTSTKFAVRGLTRAAAVDLGKDRIRVNSVHPGLTRTEMLARHPHIEKEMTARQPLPRAAEPDEVTNLVLYLASDEASYSTGAEFISDGGILAAH